jgi:hypothetical protein
MHDSSSAARLAQVPGNCREITRRTPSQGTRVRLYCKWNEGVVWEVIAILPNLHIRRQPYTERARAHSTAVTMTTVERVGSATISIRELNHPIEGSAATISITRQFPCFSLSANGHHPTLLFAHALPCLPHDVEHRITDAMVGIVALATQVATKQVVTPKDALLKLLTALA